MNAHNKIKLWIALPALVLAGCADWDQNPRKMRALQAEQSSGDIVIGAVWPWRGVKGDLWEGVEIALDEINSSGGVLGRKIRIVKEDDEGSLAKGRLVAQKFADNRDMVGVIGHLYSFIALPASSIYQSAGLVFLTPGATAYSINSQGYDLVFRSIASNKNLGNQLADYAKGQDFRRVAILYEKTTNTQSLANYFEQRARDHGLTVVDRRRFLQGSADFSQVISAWKDVYDIDAVFLAARLQEGSAFVRQARMMGLRVPIISGEGLDAAEILKNAQAEGIVIPEEISAQGKDKQPYLKFIDAYQRKHGRMPGTYPIVGYDALMLMAHGIRKANSPSPEKVAAALRSTQGWQGAAGRFSFDEKGDIPDKQIGYKMVQKGRFVELVCDPKVRCTTPGSP